MESGVSDESKRMMRVAALEAEASLRHQLGDVEREQNAFLATTW
jgi:hypothetical protein